MQLKKNKTTTKLTKQDLQKIVGGKVFSINRRLTNRYNPFKNIFHSFSRTTISFSLSVCSWMAFSIA